MEEKNTIDEIQSGLGVAIGAHTTYGCRCFWPALFSLAVAGSGGLPSGPPQEVGNIKHV